MGMFETPTWGERVGILLSVYAECCLWGRVWSFQYHFVCCESSSGPTIKLFCLWSPFVFKSHWFVTKCEVRQSDIDHSAKRNTHDHPLYFVCLCLLVEVGETSYWIRVGFVGSTQSSLFRYLFVFMVYSLLLWCTVYCYGVQSTVIQLRKQNHILTRDKKNNRRIPPEITTFVFNSWPRYTPPHYTPPRYTPPRQTPPRYAPPRYTPPRYTPPHYTPPHSLSSVTWLLALITQLLYQLLTVFSLKSVCR